MKRNRLSAMALAVVLAGASAWTALAQDQAGGNAAGGNNQQRQRGQGGQGRQRGNFDPAQMREQMMARIKERMGASDDEWKVIQPKLEKVMTAQREGRTGGFGGGPGGRRGRGGQDGAGGGNTADAQTPQREPSAVGKAQADLRAALDDKSTTPEEINKRLTALRDAREKARADRTAAQKELKEVLSARQEAALVSMGMLD